MKKTIGIIIIIAIVGLFVLSAVQPPEKPKEEAPLPKEVTKYDRVIEIIQPYWKEYDEAKTKSLVEWAEVEDMANKLSAKLKALSDLEVKIKRAGSKGEQIDSYFKQTLDVPDASVLNQITEGIDGQYTTENQYPAIKDRILKLLDGQSTKAFLDPAKPEIIPQASANENAPFP